MAGGSLRFSSLSASMAPDTAIRPQVYGQNAERALLVIGDYPAELTLGLDLAAIDRLMAALNEARDLLQAPPVAA